MKLRISNPTSPRRGFTLVELLIVVTIIVSLVSILLPSIQSAVTSAQRTACLANLRSINTALSGYAADCFGVYPTIRDPALSYYADAYDWRYTGGSYSGSLANRPALGFGLVVATGQLPVAGLGKVIHCPSYNTLDNASSPGTGMDVPQSGGATYGGSYWDSKPGWRIIGSYNYRGLSYYLQHGSKLMTTRQAVSDFVMGVDTPDTRFRGWQSQFNAHGGYNRVFGDGAASFMVDPNYEVDGIVSRYIGLGQRGTVDGRGGGGGTGNGALDEDIYKLMATHP